MNSEVLNFLTRHRVAVLTTLLPDGYPHSATVHYSYTSHPLEFFISTSSTSRKMQKIIQTDYSQASIVIGFSEEEWITLQMEGEVKMITNKEELEEAQWIHYQIHPKAEKFKKDPDTAFLKFVPTWWRYSDFNTTPPTFFSSETI